ncbi:Alkaline phosphatase [Methanosarcina barkeri str. Wiesmoor]|uniref:Alkaline phosphatase n=2 Tax=Methanosarcina barkeri TaxID=2208 RepID=A0A0E3LMB8_METBA|nr:alkaline phosphatase [Methanosarcina barkeri]AKB52746.1 Alkaline phosphatase [Methanosarcina barkeri str. Wiesmoor]
METKETDTLLIIIVTGLLLLGTVGSAAAAQFGSNSSVNFTNSTNCKFPVTPEAKIKNVIVLIPDGCSQSVETLARWYSGKPLELDNMVTGTVSTYSTDSVITDSSSAATAFAAGYKTTNGFLSVGPSNSSVLSTLEIPPEELQYRPLATVLEGSKLEGKATGLVATSRVSHATPAAFAAHVDNRDNETEIMKQMVYENVDVIFGGGSSYLVPVAEGGKRTDGENLTKVLLDRNYQYVDSRDQMMNLTTGKVWGLFASSHMMPDIDRSSLAPEQPSLAEMTNKSIELLSQDKNGFFLMVEGSQVDWADHANDPNYAVTDFLAFDKAVKVAVDFAKKDGHTLVLASPDHNTGGMTIGSNSDSNYTSTTVEDVIEPLKGMKLSSTGLETKIGTNLSSENIKKQLKNWWSIDATDEDIAEILKLYNDGKGLSLDYAISEVISRNHTVIGWTTHGHSGDDVPLWAYGPNDLTGHVDNTEIAGHIAKELGFDLNKTNSHLFIDVGKVFSKDNGDGKLDKNEYLLNMTNSSNPVLEIGDAKLPVDTNILIKNGVAHELEGIVVYAPATDKVYIPCEALSLVNGTKINVTQKAAETA